MDKIWYRNPSKSEVIGRCGGDEKTEWPHRTDKKLNDKKTPQQNPIGPQMDNKVHSCYWPDYVRANEKKKQKIKFFKSKLKVEKV